MKKIIATCLCAVLLTGCTSEKPGYIPTGNGLYVDSTTAVPTLPPHAGEQVINLAVADVNGDGKVGSYDVVKGHGISMSFFE